MFTRVRRVLLKKKVVKMGKVEWYDTDVRIHTHFIKKNLQEEV